ncbi:hypothetical protein KGQ34_01460 [Patescibacteria group bacterium]|nr:hypothetical protein [Patescibacteria group bacterium]
MQIQSKDAVLGFSFGYQFCDPGISNRELMNALVKQPQFFRMPLILQQELADCLDNKSPQFYILDREQGKIHVIRSQEINCQYVGTDTVARKGVEIAAECGFETLWVLASPWIHRPFCIWTTRFFAKQWGIKVKSIPTGWIKHDPQSTQWWTRNPLYVLLYAVGWYAAGPLALFWRRGK